MGKERRVRRRVFGRKIVCVEGCNNVMRGFEVESCLCDKCLCEGRGLCEGGEDFLEGICL